MSSIKLILSKFACFSVLSYMFIHVCTELFQSVNAGSNHDFQPGSPVV